MIYPNPLAGNEGLTTNDVGHESREATNLSGETRDVVVCRSCVSGMISKQSKVNKKGILVGSEPGWRVDLKCTGTRSRE